MDAWQVSRETDFATLACRILMPVHERQQNRCQQHHSGDDMY
jgi:hypothetical protein